jgi:hypothetical protein
LVGKNENGELKWLEIIELRAVQLDKKLLNQKVALLRDDTHPTESVKIYIDVRLETDWSVHLLHNSEQVNPRGSDIALRFKEVLKEFGIVNHSIWLERC